MPATAEAIKSETLPAAALMGSLATPARGWRSSSIARCPACASCANLSACVKGVAFVLREDLGADIGEIDPNSESSLFDARIKRYIQRSQQPIYGGREVPEYDKSLWLNSASTANLFSWLTKKRKWRNPENYRATDWYKFSEAIKWHQGTFWAILKEQKLPGVEAAEM